MYSYIGSGVMLITLGVTMDEIYVVCLLFFAKLEFPFARRKN